MEKFIAWLKEETLPGIWSKGIQFSRTSKGIELISEKRQNGQIGELRFKVQTPERVVAFEVTLWPEDQDSHCNCGSKMEPCHHIVGVALAYQNGQIQPTESRTGSKLLYTWIFESSPSAKPELKLLREIGVSGNAEPTPLTQSLVSLIGGIHSGRIRMPLLPTTQADLRIDELLSRGIIDWNALLKTLREFPPLAVKGLEGITTLEIEAASDFPKLWIEKTNDEGIRLRFEETQVEAGSILLKGGLILKGNRLSVLRNAALPHENFPPIILKMGREQFLTRDLLNLRDRYEVIAEPGAIPEFFEGEPKIEYKTHRLSKDQLAITPVITYGEVPAGMILKRNPKREHLLAQELRANLNLALDQTAHLNAESAFVLKERIFSPEIDAFLTDTLGELKSIPFATFQANRETVLQLLQLKQQNALTGAAQKLVHKFLAKPQTIPTTEALLPTSIKISKSLWEKLRDYQKQGVKWLADHFESGGGCILADDMGLGKTLQTLCVLQTPSLVVVPTSLLSNWQQEIARFRPELSVNIYHGQKREWSTQADVTLTTYGVLRSEVEIFRKTDWKVAALDEAHLIRNSDTQAAIASFQIQARLKIALTGTPIQNRVRDLWSLFQFITPDLFPSENSLKATTIAPFLLRRTKTEVLTELPPKTYLNHSVVFSENERTQYQSVWGAAKQEVAAKLDAGEKLSPLTLFEVLLRSRQICNHPGLFDLSKWESSSSKIDSLLDLLDELIEADHSVLVYSQWTKFLDRIQFSLKQKNIPWLRLDGSTQDRGGVVDQFQKGNSAKVFLLSLHAGGVGLNLTRADHVIFCDPWWNPFVEIQAEDRAYRMGQEKPVTIHRLICEKTIEEKLGELKQEKLKLGEQMLQGDFQQLSLTQNDLQHLLTDD